jgi:GxxExxY protein
MNTDKEKLNEISEKIIGAAFKVANTLGGGFLEKVYENALVHELQKSGLLVEQQKPVKVYYDGVIVGDYYSDLCVEGVIIVELKAATRIEDIHVAQCLNYLKATDLKLGLILNFGRPRLEIKRLAN